MPKTMLPQRETGPRLVAKFMGRVRDLLNRDFRNRSSFRIRGSKGLFANTLNAEDRSVPSIKRRETIWNGGARKRGDNCVSSFERRGVEKEK